MLDRNEKNALLQRVVDELREQNGDISPVILRKTVYHVAKMGSEESESEAETIYPPLLYAEAQAYMDGFSAAVDGDYSIDDTEINPKVEVSLLQSERLSQFGDLLPSYMLSRSSHYSAVVVASQPKDIEQVFGEAIPTVSTTGFILGFSQGIKDLDHGVRFKSVNPARTCEYFDKIASISVESVVEQGEHESLKKFVATCMKDLSERKISTKSGRSRFTPDTEDMCLTVYGIGVTQGIVAAHNGAKLEPDNFNMPREFGSVDAELDAWCRMNGYDEAIYEKAKKSSLFMLEQIGADETQDEMFLLNGWGFADGYAAMSESL